MKDLHYVLMTALRGPDSYSNEARAWKQLVTAPYRRFFMKCCVANTVPFVLVTIINKALPAPAISTPKKVD